MNDAFSKAARATTIKQSKCRVPKAPVGNPHAPIFPLASSAFIGIIIIPPLSPIIVLACP